MRSISKPWLKIRIGLPKLIKLYTTTVVTRARSSISQRYRITALALGLLFLASCQPTLAAERTGSDPTNALFPSDSWVALENGQQHWYAFHDEGDGTAITVRLTVLPANGATFTVWTAAQAKQWASGQSVAAVGAGTPLELFQNDLYWTGNFVQSGTYYVLVESRRQGLSNYRLTISGNGVSFPRLSFAQPSSPLADPDQAYPMAERLPQSSPSIRPTPSPTPTVTATPVSSPEHPWPPIGKSITIARGETHWYAFRDEGDESSIQVSADATPDNCLAFQLWTPEELRLWQLGEEFRPVGQGTANPTLKADLFWTGSFIKAATYYIVVERNAAVDGPCTYQLTVLGDNVSLLIPNR